MVGWSWDYANRGYKAGALYTDHGGTQVITVTLSHRDQLDRCSWWTKQEGMGQQGHLSWLSVSSPNVLSSSIAVKIILICQDHVQYPYLSRAHCKVKCPLLSPRPFVLSCLSLLCPSDL